MKFAVYNLDTDHCHGVFDDIAQAQSQITRDQISAYSIWAGEPKDDGESIACRVRIALFDPAFQKKSGR